MKRDDRSALEATAVPAIRAPLTVERLGGRSVGRGAETLSAGRITWLYPYDLQLGQGVLVEGVVGDPCPEARCAVGGVADGSGGVEELGSTGDLHGQFTGRARLRPGSRR